MRRGQGPRAAMATEGLTREQESRSPSSARSSSSPSCSSSHAECSDADPGARRRSGQPQLGRHHAARRVLPPRRVRARPSRAACGRSPTSAACPAPSRHRGVAVAELPRRRTPTPTAPQLLRRHDRLRRVARLRRRRVRLRAGRRHHRRPLPGPRPDLRAHVEQILREYLADELLEGTPPPGDWDLFAVEGGTAAICYVFDSLATNLLLRPGDRIALMVPGVHAVPRDPATRALRPRRRRDQRVARSTTNGDPTWQFPDAEIDKLADPAVKALFVVNPSNPPSVMLAPATLDRIADIVATQQPGPHHRHRRRLRHVRPRLPLADGRRCRRTRSRSTRSRSTSARPDGGSASSRSTATTCSTARIAGTAAPTTLAELDRRYESISTAHRRHPRSSTAWSPTAARSRSTTPPGLSLPQQVQMTLFATFALLDEDQSYKTRTRAIVNQRLAHLYEGMELAAPARPAPGRATTPRSTSWAGPGAATAPSFAAWLGRGPRADRPGRAPRRASAASCCSTAAASTVRRGRCGSRSPTSTTTATCVVGAAIRRVFDGYVDEWQ